MRINFLYFHAIKKVTIQGIPRKNMFDNLSSYLVEYEIYSKKLNEIQHPNLPLFKGGHFISNPVNKSIAYLVLISEAGDFSLLDLLKCRQKERKTEPPYSQEEALNILLSIVEPFRLLQLNRIYHSDIKLENIVFSESTNKFLIIDFGVSNIVPEPKENHSNFKLYPADEIELSSFIKGGTLAYFSPEKKASDDYGLFENDVFNPYKCDMWSLGVCLLKMCGLHPGQLGPFFKHPLLNEIVYGLTHHEWKSRFDAVRLAELIEKAQIPFSDPEKVERSYLKILRENSLDANYELFEQYQTANMPHKTLELAERLIAVFEKKYDGRVDKDNRNEYDELLLKLGLNFL